MVFVSDFKREFYDVVQNQRVLILVALDVDAICACRILQYLFQCDHVLYTIIPVSNKPELEKVCLESLNNVQYVVMLNCGATIDIIEMLQPPPEAVFFICDSHRPIDVHNVYNQVQVKLLIKEHEVENIPNFDDIFRDEEDASDDDDGQNSDNQDDSEATEPSGKRRRLDEDALDRRRERRLWNQNRQKTLFEYSEYTSWGSSAALIFYELSWKMSKETNDLLWLAILGVTEQYTLDKIDRDAYVDSISILQPHVSRLNPKPANGESNTTAVSHLRLTFTQELQMTLYRHWSIMESILHSRYLACRFVVWLPKGMKRLREFLAEMGLPLVQCNQRYQCMEAKLRESVKEVLIKHAPKYGVSELELLLPSFQAQFGYREKFCASDVVKGCDALLHAVDPVDDSLSSNFLRALDSLSRSKTDILMKGIEKAKSHTSIIVSQARSLYDMQQIICAGPYLYAFVQQGSTDSLLFTRPPCLCQLAKFTLEAYCASIGKKRAKQLPMILGTFLKNKDSMLLAGVSPVLDRSLKNCFGKAFEQAALSSGARITQDYFDSSVVELKLEDKTKFFDTLITFLQE